MEKSEYKLLKELLDYEMKILDLKRENIMLKYKEKMKILKYVRETEMYRHEKGLERERIKSAEIRKNLMRQHGGDAFKY